MSALGPRPTLSWIDKRQLKTGAEFQRHIDSERSKRAIEKIAAEFTWLKCQTLAVTGDLVIIDGQHRRAAAMKRDDIKDLPCLVLPIQSTAEAAQLFVAMNRDRIALTPQAIYKAELAAGLTEAMEIDAACKEAGVQALFYPIPSGTIKPHQTNAITTVRKMVRKDRARAVVVLKAAVEASAGLTAPLLRAALQRAEEGLSARELTQELKRLHGCSLTGAADSDAANRVDYAYKIMTGEIEAPKPVAPKAVPAKAAPAKKPFRFDRSKPSKAPPPPKEIRGDVLVRRFEMGASGMGNDDFLKRCGYEVSKRPNGYDVKKAGAPGKPKRLTHAQVIELLNAERKKRGLQPATVKGAA